MARLAIWALGQHARRNLLPAIPLADGVSLAGVFSRNRDVVTEASATYGCRAWDTPQAMLDDIEVDTVFIAGPNGVHHEQCRLALLSGKHVWCEKSLTPSLVETQDLLSLARSRDLVLAEAFMFAYHPQFLALKALLRRGELGRIASIRCSFGFPHLAPGDIRYSRALAGGALLDAGAYCIAAPLMLMNCAPDVVRGRTVVAPGFEVDTDGAAALFFPGNATALGDWGFGRNYRNEIEVWGENGYAIARRGFSKPPTLDTSIEILCDNELRKVEIKGGTNHFSAMMSDFARAASDSVLREALATQALRQAQVLATVRQGT